MRTARCTFLPFLSCPSPLQSASKVVSFASLPRVLERLSSMSAQLESCQRALNEFLEDKRAAFPRYACTSGMCMQVCSGSTCCRSRSQLRPVLTQLGPFRSSHASSPHGSLQSHHQSAYGVSCCDSLQVLLSG
jgi:hypothetical protein